MLNYSSWLSKLDPFVPSKPSVCYISSCDYIALFECQDFPAHLQELCNDAKRNATDSSFHWHSLNQGDQIAWNSHSLKAIILEGPKLTSWTVSCFIRAIKESSSGDLHATVIKAGFLSEIPIATALIGFYSSEQYLEGARRIFCSITAKDMICWSAMISACCKNGQYFEAIDIFREMQVFNVSPNDVTLLCVLLACANIHALLHGKEVHAFGIRRWLDSETSLCNALVDMYGNVGKQEMWTCVFERIAEKDIISWKNAIFACIRNGFPRESVQLFLAMRQQMEPNEVVTRNIIGALSQLEDSMFGSAFHCSVMKNGLSSITSVATALLVMYAELNKEDASSKLFSQLHHKDTVAWSAMVSVYTSTGRPHLALDTFRKMQLEANVQVNEITMVSLLQACSLLGAEQHVRSIHAKLIRFGHQSNLFALSALIDFYCCVGRLTQGEFLFEAHENKDLVCWSSMIKGYGMNGYGKEAIRTFNEMVERGMMLNEVVFLSILSSCSHCGLIDEGWRVFNAMEDKYCISPSVAHYCCIVDMLSRQGRLEEALNFIEKMPIDPDENVWGDLLKWCKLDDLGIAEAAVEQLVKRNPDNPSYYVTLSNMYSEMGEWVKAERIRRLIDEHWLNKAAGSSSIR